MTWRDIITPVRGFLRWLGHPIIVIGRVFKFLADMTPQQIQSISALFMLGGIVSYNVQDLFIVALLRVCTGRGCDAMADQLSRHHVIVLALVAVVGAIAWGAGWFNLKWREFELRSGRNGERDE